jgi:hypothetical protein
MFEWLKYNRSDIKWLKGPDSEGNYEWDNSLPNQQEILDLIDSYDVNWTNPNKIKVKIHNYINDSDYDVFSPPKEHDYIIGLNTSLFPVRNFYFGELQQVLWYSDIEKTNLVLRADMVYTRNSLGFVTSRTTTRTWIREDGSDHPDKKVTIKEYTQNEAISEGVTRRSNVVSGFQQPAIGLMIQAAGMSPIDAVLEGSRFMESISSQINSYIHTPRLNHFQQALTDATESWLNANIGNGVTIRQYLINFITIPT